MLKRFFPELEIDRVVRLRDMDAQIGRAYLSTLKAPDHERGKENIGAVAGSYFRRAAANSILLGGFDLACELFREAAKCYQLARMPYSILMNTLGGQRGTDWSWREIIDSPQGVYVLLQELGQKISPSNRVRKWRYEIDEFRGRRLGVLALPVDQYLDLFDALEALTIDPKLEPRLVLEALLPFVQNYSSALHRAKRDKFHWERLAMVFHPVEPDIIGLLVMVTNALVQHRLKPHVFLEGIPVARETISILGYCIDNLGRGRSKRIERDKE